MSIESALRKIAKEKKEKTGILNLMRENLSEIPNEILDLDHLTFLILVENELSNLSIVSRLKKLRALYLNSNLIFNFEPLRELPNLVTLFIGNNMGNDYSFLEKLPNLQVLNLSGNNVLNYSFLEKLPNLEILFLRHNKISDGRFLAKLINLQSLSIGSNQILDYSFLKELTNLRSLELRRSQIKDASFLKNLTNLTSLDLYSNQISDTCFLKELINLNYLNLRSNQISDTRFFNGLKNLKSLDLSSNKVSNLESFIPLIQEKELTINLNHLLSFNVLSDELLLNDGEINLYDNPITNPPIEIAKQGDSAIINFFEDIAQQGKDYLYEAKLLIIGDGGAGKTSLAWKMKDLNTAMPEKGNDRTKGIDIQALPIKNIKDLDKPFLMNVWDFGGQGYYHSTHQFFLTKRSLYVIVNNTRINKTDFNHWLQTISAFSDNSPVIIVENEVGAAKSELDLRGLQQHFDNIQFLGVVDISNTEDGRLEKLIEDIQYQIQRLPHVGSELPKQWVKIREELAEVAKTEAHISDSAFYKICKKHKITERDAIKRLGDLFHDLGIFLHFREDDVLRRTVILQNTWATKGVYEILDNGLVREKNGEFTIEQAKSIWDGTEFEDMHYELVRLMTKFELCYRIPYTNSPVAYISPNLLPTEKPAYDWDSHQNLIIYYQYEFMPKGLLGRLIVRLHRHIKDIQNMAWRNGCVFEYEETAAQVVETYGLKKLEIRVRGKHCVRLSSIVIREIDELNEGFKRIKVKKLFPCNCGTCQKLDTPHFYEYDDLMKRRAKGKRTIECSESYDDILVNQILEGVYDERAAKEKSIKELVASGKIEEAIGLFDEKHPDPNEGTLLLSRFNTAKDSYEKGTMTQEIWSVERQKIMESLLAFSNGIENGNE